MKTRKHHNNKGTQSIKSGSHQRVLIRLARELKVPYGHRLDKPGETSQ